MESKPFKLVSPFKPTGDQPAAIQKILDGVQKGKQVQVVLFLQTSCFTGAARIAQFFY